VREREGEVGGARAEGLDANEGDRILQCQPLGEVVVDRPGEAGPGDRQRAEAGRGEIPVAEHQHGGAARDEGERTQRPNPEVLAERRHRHDGGERALEVEEQRPRAGGDAREAHQHEDRPHHPAEHGDREQRRPIPASQRRVRRGSAPPAH
jgi:hypothetical protein